MLFLHSPCLCVSVAAFFRRALRVSAVNKSLSWGLYTRPTLGKFAMRAAHQLRGFSRCTAYSIVRGPPSKDTLLVQCKFLPWASEEHNSLQFREEGGF